MALSYSSPWTLAAWSGLDPDLVLALELGQGDDVVVDDGHDLLDDLLAGAERRAETEEDREPTDFHFHGHDSIL